ncbi:MAG TPA: GAF domain-containing protein [Longimicrobiales bacterium]
MLDALVRHVAETLAVSGVLVGLIDGGRQRIKAAVGVPDPWATRRERPLEAMPCRFVAATRAPLAVKDTRVHPVLRGNAAITELGMVAYAGLPILASAGPAVGTFCAWDRAPRIWEEREIRLLRDVAGVIEFEFTKRLAAFTHGPRRPDPVPALEAHADGVLVLAPDGRIIQVNLAAADFFHAPRERLVGRLLPEALPELAGTPLVRRLESLAAERVIAAFDGLCLDPYAWLEARAYPTGSGIVVYLGDITTQKHEERGAADRACGDALCADVRAAVDGAAGLDELLGRAVEHIARHFDAAYVRAWMMDPVENVLEPRAFAGTAAPGAADARATPPERLKVGVVALQRRAQRTNHILDDPHLGEQDWALRDGIAGFAACPIIAGGGVIGVLAVFRRHPATRELLDGLRAVAEILAPALHRGRTEAHAQRLTRAPEPSTGGEGYDFRFLAEASELLDTSLDYETTLANIARLVVPRLGDVCFIDIIDDDGTIRRIEAAHADPEKTELVRGLKPYTPRIDTAQGIGKVLRTGQPELVAEISDAFIEAIARDGRHLELLRRLGPRSAMIVPLVARERIIGAITLVLATAARQYRSADLALARDLARRAALAADNARLYLRARTAQDQAEAAVRWRDQVLAIVSHDLKNPLSLVFTAADMLGQQLAEGAAAKQIETIRRSAEQMNRLIDDLLDAATIETGKLSLAPRDEDAAGILLEVYELFRQRAEENGLRLDCEIDPAVGTVRADRRRVLQVLANMIGNAFEFTQAGGRITLRGTAHEDGVLFSVSDTGRGIAPQHLPYLFDGFWRAEPTGRRGTGLGLTIAKGIIEAHHGRIWAESRPGEGSTFYFTLPAAR